MVAAAETVADPEAAAAVPEATAAVPVVVVEAVVVALTLGKEKSKRRGDQERRFSLGRRGREWEG